MAVTSPLLQELQNLGVVKDKEVADRREEDGKITSESTKKDISRQDDGSARCSKSVRKDNEDLDLKRQEIEELPSLIREREKEIYLLEKGRALQSGSSREESRGKPCTFKRKERPFVKRVRSRESTPERSKWAPSRRRRSRSKTQTPKKGRSRKHHRDIYKISDSDREREELQISARLEEDVQTA